MVSSQARYVAIPTIESNAGVGSPSSSSSSRHTSASSSLSSSPRQNSDATLYPYPAGHDQPYELSEKSAWHSRVTSNPTYPPHHLGAVKSNQSLTEGVVHLWRKCKTTILIAICFLLALMLFWQSDHRDPAIGASSSSSNSSSSSSSSLPITTTALPTLHMAQASKSYRLEDDMVLITKVGSATAHKRLLIHLAEQPLSNLYTPNHIYVSDFALTLGNITFYDALANVSTTIAQLDEFKSLRAELTALMQSNQDLDDMSQKDGGWKLDKYKFLPAIAEAYRRFPAKKWYVMVEADTFLFWNQLVKWLSTLDENKQLMIGHPSFCDYDGQSTMFTHGGSGIVLSKAIVEASFGQDSDFEHTHDELIQKSAFGDALLSKSIYDSPLVTLNELSPEGGEKFNSDPPRVLKFTRDNWCTPIMSFHHITPADAAHLYDFERRIEARLDSKDLVRWADVWDEFIPNFLKDAMDQVGRFDADSQLADHSAEPGEVGVVGWQAIEDWDSETTDLTTLDALECQKWCRAHTNCLLWQWRRVKSQDASDQVESGKCRFTTDFLRIGLTKPNSDDGLTSGWMGTRIDAWRRDHECSGRTGLNSYNLDDLD